MTSPQTEEHGQKVTKTFIDYFNQNKPVYTENELQEAIKLSKSQGAAEERKRVLEYIDIIEKGGDDAIGTSEMRYAINNFRLSQEPVGDKIEPYADEEI